MFKHLIFIFRLCAQTAFSGNNFYFYWNNEIQKRKDFPVHVPLFFLVSTPIVFIINELVKWQEIKYVNHSIYLFFFFLIKSFGIKLTNKFVLLFQSEREVPKKSSIGIWHKTWDEFSILIAYVS